MYRYAGIQLSMYTRDTARRVARGEVTSSQASTKSHSLVTGPNSLLFGSTSPGVLCLTCFEPAGKCAGHLGCISFGLPIFNSDRTDQVLKVLQCTCFWCGRLLALNLVLHPLPLAAALEDLSAADFEALRTVLNERVIDEKKLVDKLEAQCKQQVKTFDPPSPAKNKKPEQKPASEDEDEDEDEADEVVEAEEQDEEAKEREEEEEQDEDEDEPEAEPEAEDEEQAEPEEEEEKQEEEKEDEVEEVLVEAEEGGERPLKKSRKTRNTPSKMLFAAKTQAAASLARVLAILRTHTGKARLAEMALECKKIKVCGGVNGVGCGAEQPVFVREGHFVTARMKGWGPVGILRKNNSKRRFMRRQDHVPVSLEELKAYSLHVLVALRSFRLLEQMHPSTATLLGFNPTVTPPAAWMFAVLVVGAPRTRPGIDIKNRESLQGHNDITCEIQKIVRHNTALKKHLSTFLEHYRAQMETDPRCEAFVAARVFLDPIAAFALQLDDYFVKRYKCHFWQQPKIGLDGKQAKKSKKTTKRKGSFSSSESEEEEGESPVLKGRTLRKLKPADPSPAVVVQNVVQERVKKVRAEAPRQQRAAPVGEELFVDAADHTFRGPAVSATTEIVKPTTHLDHMLLAIRWISFSFDLLQEQVGTMINNTERASVKVSMQPNGRATKSIHERLNGKDGLVRGHGIGKRRDYSGRAPLLPDPTLPIGWFGLPGAMAMKLTIPDRVSALNIHRLTAAVRNGPYRYPGARFVIPCTSTTSLDSIDEGGLNRFDLRFVDHDSIVLEIGWIVERHAQDGDQFAVNRQPSLHRASIMTHRALVMPKAWGIYLNVEVMIPYGADADGDEVNVMPERSVEARVAALMMSSEHHMFNPKNGDLVVRFQLDSIIGPYFLTLPSAVLSHSAASILLAQVNESMLPKPLVLPPSDAFLPDGEPGWSGRTLFSALLPSDLSLDTKGAPDGVLEDPSKVVVHRGRLLSGTLNGQALGRILSSIEKAYGSSQAAGFMHNVVQMCTHYLQGHGVTVGFSNCDNPDKVFTNSMRTLARDWALAQPGPAKHGSEAETKLLAVFDAARTRAGNVVLHAMKKQHSLSEPSSHLDALNRSVHRNGILELILSGTKGSLVILHQLTVFLGLQVRHGKRILENIPLRTAGQTAWTSNLNGFIGQSYHEGIGVEEFFFAAMAAREGVVGTAVKTALVGYLQRKLINGMNGMVITGNGTVRLVDGAFISAIYGGDNFNGMRVEWTTLPSLTMTFEQVKEHEGEHEVADKVVAQILKHREYFLRLKATESILSSRADTNRAGQVLALGGVREIYAAALRHDEAGDCECSATELFVTVERFIESEVLPFHHGNFPIAFIATVRETFSPRQLIKARVTRKVLMGILTKIKTLHSRSLIGVHEQVGILAAQSFGEPITQMTLKSPHNSGHHSGMVMGVPRTHEIINATKTPGMQTPVMSFKLKEKDKHKARIFANKMIHTVLASVAETGQVLETSTPWLSEDERSRVAQTRMLASQEASTRLRGIRIVLKRAELIKCGLSPAAVADACVATTLKKCTHLVVVCSPLHAPEASPNDPPWVRFEFDSNDEFMLEATAAIMARFWKPPKGKAAEFDMDMEAAELCERGQLPPTLTTAWEFALQGLLARLLHSTCVFGWAGIKAANVRTVKVFDADSILDVGSKSCEVERAEIVTAGSSFERLLHHPAVEWQTAITNSIEEVREQLGIAAARCWIVTQIEDVLSHNNCFVHRRHIELIAAVMTRTGELGSFSRHKVIRDVKSPLARSSFEKCAGTFSEAAAFGELDKLQGVAENVMLGNTAPLGTAKVRVEEAKFSLHNEWRFAPLAVKNRAALRARRVRHRPTLLDHSLKTLDQVPWTQQGTHNIELARWVALFQQVKKSAFVDASKRTVSSRSAGALKFVCRQPSFFPLTADLVSYVHSAEDLARALDGSFVPKTQIAPSTQQSKPPRGKKESVFKKRAVAAKAPAAQQQPTNTILVQW